jgi:hypothetical protein
VRTRLIPPRLPGGGSRRGGSRGIMTAMPRILNLLAAAVRLVASVIAALILVHAVFVLFEANPDNVLVHITTGVRDFFGWFTVGLFTTDTPKVGEAVNDALAAVIYVVLGSLVSKLIVRAIPATKAKTS